MQPIFGLDLPRQEDVQGTHDARRRGKAKAKEADSEEGLSERTPLLIRVQARAARGERGEDGGDECRTEEPPE